MNHQAGVLTTRMDDFSVLFCRADSIYKRLGCDTYDASRNATTWPGGKPVIAHPPCRSWSRLKAFSRPVPGEREAAIWVVDQIRQHGGVLEHPSFSSLWEAADMPLPGTRDAYNGWTLPIAQFWLGHKCMKMTWLYIVGCEPADIPAIPLTLGDAPYVVGNSKTSTQKRPEISKADRERTPEPFALWLIDLVQRIAANRHQGNSTPMAKGHNSPQKSAHYCATVSRAEPRPRHTLEAQHPLTASERFLARFNAAPGLSPKTAQPRALNNPASPTHQHPLIERQGDLFLTDSTHNAPARPTTGSGHGTAKAHVAADTAALHSPAQHALATAQHTGGSR